MTRRKFSRPKSAASRARRLRPGSTTTWPTNSPAGYNPSAPDVTIRSPAAMSSGVSMKSISGAALLSPVRRACCPDGWINTGTRLLLSVNNKTRAVRSPRPAIRPTKPSPSMAAHPSSTPSRAPTFSSTERRNGDPLSAKTIPEIQVSDGSG